MNSRVIYAALVPAALVGVYSLVAQAQDSTPPSPTPHAQAQEDGTSQAAPVAQSGQQETTPPPAVDSKPVAAGEGSLHDVPLESANGAERRVAISWNPLTLLLTRASLNVEIMPVWHHALVLTGFYGSTTTNDDSYNNVFQGWGGEIGYRYYTGSNGPRGFYVGPSFLLARYDAIPKRGADTEYWNFGGAVDLGYQAIVFDRWVAGLGVGVQYTAPTATFPQQELPASVYANPHVRPRMLMSLGVAF